MSIPISSFQLGYQLQLYLGTATHVPPKRCWLEGRRVLRARENPPQRAAGHPCCRNPGCLVKAGCGCDGYGHTRGLGEGLPAKPGLGR